MSDTLPNEVREAIIDGLVKSATEARDCINEIRGIKIDRPVSRAIFQKDADYALSALEAAGWVCVPVGDQRFTVREVIDALIAAGFTRVQQAASNPKEKQDV